MSALQQVGGLPAFSMTEQDLLNVMRNSLYPGAQDDSIKLVISYCKAAGLDPMQKPVHIVPMWDNKARAMRDVIMPGIGSYRTQAARSGEYAGVSEPEFGPDVVESVGGTEITYPAWCRVTVRRLLPNGVIADFAATERWKENYATAGKDSQAPNAMWKRRPYAQLAKCAEAQALRKAFPEFGSQPTADEMEGRDVIERDITPPALAIPEVLPPYPDDKFVENFDQWELLIREGKRSADDIILRIQSRNALSELQEAAIRACAADAQQGKVHENA